MRREVKSTTLPINRLKKVFASLPVDFVYLFGSYAARTMGDRSDVDIAILFDGGVVKSERFGHRLKLMETLSRLLKKDVDIIVLNDVSSLFFKYAIVKESKLLYEKSEAARIEFERKLLGEFFDFQPFLNRYNDQYVQARI